MAKTFRRGDRLNVHVDRLSVGGRGVARHQGLVIFIDLAAPDEDVEIELSNVKKNFAEARLIRVIKTSPHRVTPPCPVAGVCGGCNWQQVSYPEQLKQKRALVIESLRKFSGFALSEQQVAEVVASPNEFRYRNRIQLHHSGPRAGFHKRGSHEIVDIDDCPITEKKIACEIPRIKKEFVHRKAGRIELYLSQDGEFSVRDLSSTDERAADNQNLDEVGPAFAQVNTAQNIRLIDFVIERLKISVDRSRPAKIYDLYAGSGNFTFPLARALPELPLIAVELNKESVERATAVIERDFKHHRDICFVQSDVGAYLAGHSLGNEIVSQASAVLLDPPRTGCGPEVMASLASARPQEIVYVSCHPVTLSRDLQALSQCGYGVEVIQPFDMFPQTDHVETVIHLRLDPS